MKIRVQAMKENLSLLELEKHIPKETLNRIKGKGVLQPYVLAHEGTSQPKVLEEGRGKKLNWLRTTIKKIGSKIRNGIKFFVDHGKGTNAHDNRKPVGEVVGSFVGTVKDKLSNIVIGYFEDANLAEKMDVCSMEADVAIDEESDTVVDLNELSGIALGSSSENSPAFPGAVRLATLQCFDEDDEGSELPKGNEGGHEMAITFQEVKDFVRNNNVWPSQLFDEKVVRSDREFANVFDERDKLKTRVTELEEENKKVKDESSKALRTAQTTGAKERIKELLPEGLTKKQEAFILKKFNPEKMEDLTDKGISEFINQSKDEFAEIAPLFTEETNTNKNEDEESTDDGKKSSGDAVMDAVSAIVGE